MAHQRLIHMADDTVLVEVVIFDEFFSCWDGEPAAEFLAALSAAIDGVPPQFRALAKIEMCRAEYDYIGMEVKYQRPETAEEAANREADETASRVQMLAQREAQERASLQALLRKYGMPK